MDRKVPLMLVRQGEGRDAQLGVVNMRVLASAAQTGGAFSLVEFTGGPGAWTVPHVHDRTDESFFVLDGHFSFNVDGADLQVGPSEFVLVRRGLPHVMTAGEGGGRFLTLWCPGGNEEMFFELAALGADALRDPEARVAVSHKYDSRPVAST
jgi:mannose-6-phosphate isomerase-like protein (cupin superfamily)